MTNRREEIASSLARVHEEIDESARAAGRRREDITLICVTKTYPASDVEILASLGECNFGENRIQEGLEKSSLVTGRWHFQGQIQSNKIKHLVKWADVIHSIDDLNHLEEIDRRSERKIDTFIQVTLDSTPGRGGVEPSRLAAFADAVASLTNLNLLGIMAVAPLGEDPARAFARLADIHQNFLRDHPESPYLSAGMSGDFQKAIAHGATHIRVGSSILGSRNP